MKIIFSLSIVIALAGCFGIAPEKTGKEGKPMPNFSMLLTDSSTWIHSIDIPVGKPSVLFYLSPHCPYCRAQTKTIIENIDVLKNIQFYFISDFPLAQVKKFYHENQLGKYPNIYVGLDSANTISNYFEIPAFPYLAIYGKDKTLNKTYIGSIYSRQLKNSAEE